MSKTCVISVFREWSDKASKWDPRITQLKWNWRWHHRRCEEWKPWSRALPLLPFMAFAQCLQLLWPKHWWTLSTLTSQSSSWSHRWSSPFLSWNCWAALVWSCYQHTRLNGVCHLRGQRCFMGLMLCCLWALWLTWTLPCMGCWSAVSPSRQWSCPLWYWSMVGLLDGPWPLCVCSVLVVLLQVSRRLC